MPLFYVSADQAVVYYKIASPNKWPFLYAIHLFQCIDFVPFTIFTDYTKIKCKWGSAAAQILKSRRNKSQEALFLCPLLHLGVPVCSYPMDWPLELELDQPLECFVEPAQLWEGIQVLLWFRCHSLSEPLLYYCSKVSVQFVILVLWQLLIGAML